jgi:hypothetical protein
MSGFARRPKRWMNTIYWAQLMSRSEPVNRPTPSEPSRVASRYELHELLGRGGIAEVHRATDLVLGRQVALKQLTVDPLAPGRAQVAALFEREFHTLAQVSHPHVIEVFDYGLFSDGAPFYTMELLDGGDLRERAPLPWREACRVVFDVCSALALLHSRRLLHRDITPRNIRCTQSGIAKLIDFGAMSPMSAGGLDVVGTPAFTAPETLQRLALDARTDLYSLGVTLYFALTAHAPYFARTFSELLGAWADKPAAPSKGNPEIPAVLDDLVFSLINVEPSLRPASAFEVMQRLAAIAGLRVEESAAVSRAYLSTPTLVGRSEEIAQLRTALRESRLRRSAGVLVRAAPGLGRSRVLDACALDAATHGFTVARATATGAREPFTVAQRIVAHVLDTLPQAAQLAAVPELFVNSPTANDAPGRPTLTNIAALDAGHAQKLLRRFIQTVSRTCPLLIAVDDVHRIDEPSAALLAELIDTTRRGGILVALTADSEAADNAALQALERRCSVLPLAALNRVQTRKLLDSLFGDVAYLEMLGDEIHDVAHGNPRDTLELAQHLVDRGLIRYASGSWTLPSRLCADDLPRSAQAAMQARAARFSDHARFLAEAHALAFYEELSTDNYRTLLPAASAREVDLALSELLAAGAVLRDGAIYRLANRVWIAAFLAGVDEEQLKLRHCALAHMYKALQSLGFIHHAFAGGLDELGLAGLARREEAPRDEATMLKLVEQNAGRLSWCYPRAIETARRLGRSARNVHDLRRWQYFNSVVSSAPMDRKSARIWLEQLTHDSGLDLYRADTQSKTPQERLTNALSGAHARYLATPEHERVYPVDQAIRKLGEYVVVGVVEGARTLNTQLLWSLPDIVEPFTPLSPMLEAIWLNMLGARAAHCNCDYERARELWRSMLQKLDTVEKAGEVFVASMRNAVIFAMGSAESQLGLASAGEWAERLEHDPFQRVSALNLRKAVCLEQGDAQGAERLRRQAEVLSLQLRIPSMFNGGPSYEVFAYAQSNHLAGLTQVIEHIKRLAARCPAWVPVLLNAEGCFELVRGDYQAARAKLEACIELDRKRVDGLPVYAGTLLSTYTALAETLMCLGRDEEARASASASLADCEARGSANGAFELIRALALAEGKLGDARGAQRLDALIARQNALGSTGLRMGLSYEARARIAIWSGDAAAFEHFSELTAREYRHGARAPLGARYERLMNEATRAGMHAKLTLGDFQALAGSNTSALGTDELYTMVTRSMGGHRSADERTQIALQMICAAHAARVGHLFMLTPAGPVLRASHGASAPAVVLQDRVTAFVTENQRHTQDLDDTVTGALEDEAALDLSVCSEDRRYELLPLSCVVEATSVLVGIAVIETAEDRGRSEQQAQLLRVLATSLLQTADSSS